MRLRHQDTLGRYLQEVASRTGLADMPPVCKANIAAAAAFYPLVITGCRDDMQIFVKTLPGKIFALNVKASGTINIVKTKIRDWHRMPVEQQHLFFHGKPLEGHCTLDEYKIQNVSTLHLVAEENIHRGIAVQSSQFCRGRFAVGQAP